MSSDRIFTLWDLKSGQQLWRYTSANSILWVSPSWSPDGKLIAFGLREEDGSERVFILEAESGQVRASFPTNRGYTTFLRFSPHGDRLATYTNGELTLWETRTWQEVLSISLYGYIDQLLFTPDGHQIHATVQQIGFRELTSHVWDATPLPEQKK